MAKFKGETVEVPTWILLAMALIVLVFIGILIFNHVRPRLTVTTHGPYGVRPHVSRPQTYKKN